MDKFDEAVEQINALTMDGMVGLAPEVAFNIFEGLRKEYAPNIEMTQQQKDVFMHFKENTWFSSFLAKFNDPDFGESLPDLSCFENWGFSKDRENDLMIAWLHPESIKVVE